MICESGVRGGQVSRDGCSTWLVEGSDEVRKCEGSCWIDAGGCEPRSDGIPLQDEDAVVFLAWGVLKEFVIDVIAGVVGVLVGVRLAAIHDISLL